ncbi:MAG TPA: hypothetical protein VNT51_06035 [Miltoncostaeaceae bacterium]|jgi:hypothetical protein|nr:hypothetical protein [Miltoncostaeaceae bacterium]
MGLMDRAKDAAKVAAERAQKGLDEAKDAGQKVTLKRRLTALSAELGDTVYRQREGEAGLDPEIDRLVGEMRAVRAEIEALQED